jgi:D-3-phosphoglycerate dehydrogenase
MRLGEKIGSLQAQLTPRAPREIRIDFQGEAAEIDSRPVTASVLKGLLANVVEAPVNAVNAPIFARERGIRVVELRHRETEGFTNSIKVEFASGGKSRVIEGAVFGRNIRLVRFEDFYLEAIPEGYILVLHNRDVPGVVGNVGTFLGKQGINIAGLELGRVEGEAISFVHVDSPLDAKQLEQLRKLPDITGADMVRLA